MSRPKQKQILPRRLEVIVEKLDQAKESYESQSPEWELLDRCQRQIRELLSQYITR